MTHYLLVFVSLLGIECAGFVGLIVLYQKTPSMELKKVSAAMFALLALFYTMVWYGLDVTPRAPAIVLAILSVVLMLGGIQRGFVRSKT